MPDKFPPPNYLETCQKIVYALETGSSELAEKDRIPYVYNMAMDDAAEFVKVLAEKNPAERLAFQRLEAEMRRWLPLRTEI